MCTKQSFPSPPHGDPNTWRSGRSSLVQLTRFLQYLSSKPQQHSFSFDFSPVLSILSRRVHFTFVQQCRPEKHCSSSISRTSSSTIPKPAYLIPRDSSMHPNKSSRQHVQILISILTPMEADPHHLHFSSSFSMRNIHPRELC